MTECAPLRSTKEGTRKEDGYPESAYRVSKAAEIAYTMLQHRQLEGRNITVNAVGFKLLMASSLLT